MEYKVYCFYHKNSNYYHKTKFTKKILFKKKPSRLEGLEIYFLRY